MRFYKSGCTTFLRLEEHCCAQGQEIPVKTHGWLQGTTAQNSLLAPSLFAPFSSCSSVQCWLFRAQSHVLQMLCTKNLWHLWSFYKSQGTLITQSEPIIPRQAPQSMGFADSLSPTGILPVSGPRQKFSISPTSSPWRCWGCTTRLGSDTMAFQDLEFPIPQTSFAEIGNLFDTEQAGSPQPFQELSEGGKIKEKQAPDRLIIPDPEAGTPLCSFPVLHRILPSLKRGLAPPWSPNRAIPS